MKIAFIAVVVIAGVCVTGISGCNRHVTNVSTVQSSNKSLTSHAEKKPESINSKISYSTYVNKTLGFSAKYPSSWTEIPQTRLGATGRSFEIASNVKSYDNGLTINVPRSNVVIMAFGFSGSYFNNFTQMKDLTRKFVASLKGKKNVLSASYGGEMPNKWVWFTGTAKIGHNAIHIDKEYQTLRTVQVISITFPANETSKYMPIWNYVSTHFIPGEKKE